MRALFLALLGIALIGCAPKEEPAAEPEKSGTEQTRIFEGSSETATAGEAEASAPSGDWTGTFEASLPEELAEQARANGVDVQPVSLDLREDGTYTLSTVGGSLGGTHKPSEDGKSIELTMTEFAGQPTEPNTTKLVIDGAKLKIEAADGNPELVFERK